MSPATALTIIAIAMAVLAVIAILAVIFLLRLVIHLIAFEQTLGDELAELRSLVSNLRETTERVSHTVHDVQIAARRVGGAVGAIASLFMGRNTRATRLKSRPWWVTGAALGWTLIKRRRQKKAKQPKSTVPAPKDTSLPL
ncbi:hypothetical protein [Sulfobacillus harzensis]|uniref:DUF948 domain-containing protein n=1 Tax=Sulfobacillus harzensis TaxID=2729629 RepID=A0A7Y0Q1Z3_9FIRM|nr:hypothetical protein [Sulfobacillus harzensis]NMP21962.1 hypothetical protein [Sulfobacillus harzensis]